MFHEFVIFYFGVCVGCLVSVLMLAMCRCAHKGED